MLPFIVCFPVHEETDNDGRNRTGTDVNLDLKGKVVVITGGSKGIGLACAKAIHAEGARVIICSRSRANITAALEKLPGGEGIDADLTIAEQALAVVDWIYDRFGHIDVLINSAGAARRSAPGELNPEIWRAAMDAKYFSYINIIDPVIKRMAAARSGVIVNVIGAGGKVASPIHLAGGAANAALMLATVGLANAYAKDGVRVVGVNPGATQTGRVAEGIAAEAQLLGISEDAALADVVSRIPLGRLAAPEEIANVVVFLSSAAASYMTGINISLDGAAAPVVF